jgi:hypothetical protein
VLLMCDFKVYRPISKMNAKTEELSNVSLHTLVCVYLQENSCLLTIDSHVASYRISMSWCLKSDVI